MVKEYFCDILFINAKVITVDEKDSIKEAVGILEHKIVFVGTTEKAMSYRGKDTKVIDAKGKTIMPGFIDAHIHFAMYGLLDKGIINIDYTHVDSIKEILEIVQKVASTKKKGDWIVLSGYDNNKLSEKRHPSIEELDMAAPDNPVQCTRCCAHMAVYNTVAIDTIGVAALDLFAPDEVVIDSNGKLTGLLKENAHMRLAKNVKFSDQEIMDGIVNANNIMTKYGITSVHDAGSFGMKVTGLLQKACEDKMIDVRVRPMVFDMFGKESGKEYINHFLHTGIHTNIGDDRFQLGPIKIMLDGSTSGPSSATIKPYCHDPGSSGLQIWQQEEADELIMKVHKSGCQMTAHAVGDKAVELVINAYEKALRKYPKENHRHRIEHCGLNNPELIERIKKLGVIPVSNPAFISINASDYNRFYGKRVDFMFPLKSYLEEGIIAAIGSDSPVTHPNPMYSLYGAVNRKDSKTRTVCGTTQKVEILEVIRMFTYNGAYAAFEEDKKGSIEVGKLADIIMLSEDITAIHPEKLMETEVLMTIIDGKIVFHK